MHLYVIRHGESYVNLEDYQGYADLGLTDLGQRQAQALAAWIPTAIPTIDVLYSSTLTRARETATFVARAYQSTIQEDDRIREIGTSRFDHTPWPGDGLPQKFDFWATNRPLTPHSADFTGSESWMHFRIRVGSFIEEILDRHPDEVVVAVCHGAVTDAIFDHIFNVGPWRKCELWTTNTGITYFEHFQASGREPWRLHYFNRVDHMNGHPIG